MRCARSGATRAAKGVDDPGVFPVAPDLVEALVENEELDEARDVTGRLRELAEEQSHPWGLASVKRCEGLLRFPDDSESATASLLAAVSDYEALGLRFDAARTLLLLGGMQRRHRKVGRGTRVARSGGHGVRRARIDRMV